MGGGVENDFAHVGDISKVARGTPTAPSHNLGLIGGLGLQKFANQGRNYMRVVQIKIIVGTVEIARHQDNGVKPVLPPVGLRLNGAHGFGQRIGRAFRLRHAIEKLGFLNRAGRMGRIATPAYESDIFARAGAPAFVQHHGVHEQVLVTEIRRTRRLAPMPPINPAR